MTEWRARLLTRTELPLANRFYREYQPSMRAHGDEHVWLLQGRITAAAVRLKPVAEGFWLTGLFVIPEYRGKGLAGQLLNAALAYHDGPVWLFCQPGLSGFYRRHGFQAAEQLPEELVGRLTRYRTHQTLEALGRR